MELYYIFARIGLFTFGGGYAMISIIEDICVERKKWISHEEMMNMTVIAESTPGPIAINCATYVGYKLAGLAGAIVPTFGMVLPSFVVIFIVSKFINFNQFI
jgi:chromate transporter